jgi:hypothetical protein
MIIQLCPPTARRSRGSSLQRSTTCCTTSVIHQYPDRNSELTEIYLRNSFPFLRIGPLNDVTEQVLRLRRGACGAGAGGAGGGGGVDREAPRRLPPGLQRHIRAARLLCGAAAVGGGGGSAVVALY